MIHDHRAVELSFLTIHLIEGQRQRRLQNATVRLTRTGRWPYRQ